MHPMATGFTPLDDILNGGLRPGELLVIGGPFGVGKTIWGLQVARNAVCAGPETPPSTSATNTTGRTYCRACCAWKPPNGVCETTH